MFMNMPSRQKESSESMNIQTLAIPEVMLITPERFSDARGSFAETYRRDRWAEMGISADFMQDNQAFSSKAGTVRGLHFQAPPHAQAKMIRVLNGTIFDVAVDLRQGSPSFGRHVSVELSADSLSQLYIPSGFAHGYCTLTPDTAVLYKVDEHYAPECEGGILWADPDLNIDWPFPWDDVIISEKDKALPTWKDFTTPFGCPA